MTNTVPTIYMMVGLPASGKSTWIEANLPDLFVVSSDKYIEEYAAAQGKTYADVFREHIDEAGRKALFDFNMKVKNGESFVLDRTNMTIKGRQSFLKKVKQGNYRKVAVVFDVPEELRTERHDIREEITGKSVPPWIINNMRSSYDEPTLGEGFDEIIIVKE